MIVLGLLMSIISSAAAMWCIAHGLEVAGLLFKAGAWGWLIGALAGMTDWSQ